MEMFENCVRNKLRFESTKGLLSAEDLWDLPLSSRNSFDLDTIATALDEAISKAPKQSFVKATSSVSKSLKDKFDVVKYIIEVKLAEAEANKQAVVNASKKAFLQEIIHEKTIDALKGKSLEELEAELSAL